MVRVNHPMSNIDANRIRVMEEQEEDWIQ